VAEPDEPLEADQPEDERRAHEIAEWAQEFLYGTIAVLTTIAGIEVGGADEPVAAGAIVLTAAIATWLAHSYAILFGRRIAHGHRFSTSELGHGLRRSFPIVLAAVPAVILAGLARAGVWPLETALQASNAAGLAVMVGAGLIGARASRANTLETILSVAMALGIGLLVVGIGLVFHH
jgi:hypothetical protein